MTKIAATVLFRRYVEENQNKNHFLFLKEAYNRLSVVQHRKQNTYLHI